MTDVSILSCAESKRKVQSSKSHQMTFKKMCLFVCLFILLPVLSGLRDFSFPIRNRARALGSEKEAFQPVDQGSMGRESACSAGDLVWIPDVGRSPGEGNGNPLQYSRLENPMDRGAWRAAVHGVAESQTRLSN